MAARKDMADSTTMLVTALLFVVLYVLSAWYESRPHLPPLPTRDRSVQRE
jgi:hypothetical protein